MLEYKIYYNGKYEDEITISGNTMEEIKDEAFEECKLRGWDLKDCWSEQV